MIRVLIADDHAIVRRGLEELISSEPDMEIVGVAVDGRDAIALAIEHRPDVVLMDLSMPNVDGFTATRALLDAQRDCRVVALTSFADQRNVVHALNAGAIGYLMKDSPPDDLIAGIRSAANGESPLHPKAAAQLLEARRAEQRRPNLSPREREVVRLVGDGLANKEIARRLAITERTVKAHLTSIFHQLDVANRNQAARWAREHLSMGTDATIPDAD